MDFGSMLMNLKWGESFDIIYMFLKWGLSLGLVGVVAWWVWRYKLYNVKTIIFVKKANDKYKVFQDRGRIVRRGDNTEIFQLFRRKQIRIAPPKQEHILIGGANDFVFLIQYGPGVYDFIPVETKITDSLSEEKKVCKACRLERETEDNPFCDGCGEETETISIPKVELKPFPASTKSWLANEIKRDYRKFSVKGFVSQYGPTIGIGLAAFVLVAIGYMVVGVMNNLISQSAGIAEALKSLSGTITSTPPIPIKPIP